MYQPQTDLFGNEISPKRKTREKLEAEYGISIRQVARPFMAGDSYVIRDYVYYEQGSNKASVPFSNLILLEMALKESRGIVD